MVSRSSIPLLEPSGKHQTIPQLALWSIHMKLFLAAIVLRAQAWHTVAASFE